MHREKRKKTPVHLEYFGRNQASSVETRLVFILFLLSSSSHNSIFIFLIFEVMDNVFLTWVYALKLIFLNLHPWLLNIRVVLVWK